MKTITSRLSSNRGFTLIETLVVMAISVGLVVLMAGLFRMVGHATLALKGGNPEWAVQTLLRGQLAQGFQLPNQAWTVGTAHELTFLTWRSRVTGLDGKPVIAQYRFDPDRRVLSYREATLPAWWSDTPLPTVSELGADLGTVTPVTLMGAVESLDFNFIPTNSTNLEPAQWRSSWQQTVLPPKLIVLRFSRLRDHTLWLEVRASGAL